MADGLLQGMVLYASPHYVAFVHVKQTWRDGRPAASVAEVIEGMGGRVVGELVPGTTHVAAWSCGQPPAHEGARAGLPLVSPVWAWQLAAGKAHVDPARDSLYRPLADVMAGADGCEVSLTGFTLDLRSLVTAAISAAGFSLSRAMNLWTCTHLVAADVHDAGSRKVERARSPTAKHKIHVVNVAWLYDCMRAGRLLPAGDYLDNRPGGLEPAGAGSALGAAGRAADAEVVATGPSGKENAPAGEGVVPKHVSVELRAGRGVGGGMDSGLGADLAPAADPASAADPAPAAAAPPAAAPPAPSPLAAAPPAPHPAAPTEPVARVLRFTQCADPNEPSQQPPVTDTQLDAALRRVADLTAQLHVGTQAADAQLAVALCRRGQGGAAVVQQVALTAVDGVASVDGDDATQAGAVAEAEHAAPVPAEAEADGDGGGDDGLQAEADGNAGGDGGLRAEPESEQEPAAAAEQEPAGPSSRVSKSPPAPAAHKRKTPTGAAAGGAQRGNRRKAARPAPAAVTASQPAGGLGPCPGARRLSRGAGGLGLAAGAPVANRCMRSAAAPAPVPAPARRASAAPPTTPAPARRATAAPPPPPPPPPRRPYVAVGGLHTAETAAALVALRRAGLSAEGGGVAAPRWNTRTTHVVEPRARRTAKTLAALAAGAWVVGMPWVAACVAAGGQAPEAAHELTAGNPLLAAGVARHWRLRAARTGGGAFQGTTWAVANGLCPRGERPDADDVARILRAGGAAVVPPGQRADAAVVPPGAARSDPAVAAALGSGTPCVAPAYVIEWLAHPRAALDGHVMFGGELVGSGLSQGALGRSGRGA